jgi:hypothetical protein
MSSAFRFPPQARLVLAALALFMGAAPACGGIVRISDGTGGTGGVSSFDPGGPIVPVRNSGGTSNEGTGGEAGAVPVSQCGNGQIDTGEECDGPLLNGKTCSTETMGAEPSGVLSCTTECLLETLGCSAGSGTGGFGGGVGGGFGVGGGIGGQGGTFGGGGTTGLDEQNAALCLDEYVKRDGVEATTSTTCGPGCNCTLCTAPFATCLSDDGCLAILECAEKFECTTDASCYSPSTCQPEIDQWGGPSGYSMSLFDSAAACSPANGCQLECLTTTTQ